MPGGDSIESLQVELNYQNFPTTLGNRASSLAEFNERVNPTGLRGCNSPRYRPTRDIASRSMSVVCPVTILAINLAEPQDMVHPR